MSLSFFVSSPCSLVLSVSLSPPPPLCVSVYTSVNFCLWPQFSLLISVFVSAWVLTHGTQSLGSHTQPFPPARLKVSSWLDPHPLQTLSWTHPQITGSPLPDLGQDRTKEWPQNRGRGASRPLPASSFQLPGPSASATPPPATDQTFVLPSCPCGCGAGAHPAAPPLLLASSVLMVGAAGPGAGQGQGSACQQETEHRQMGGEGARGPADPKAEREPERSEKQAEGQRRPEGQRETGIHSLPPPPSGRPAPHQRRPRLLLR